MKYALFVGCTTLARLPGYEKSARNVATKLGVELVDMPGSSCCGTTYLETLDHKTGLAIAARNIAIAEEMGMDIVTVCNGCTEVLTKANKELKEDPELMKEVNGILAEAGKEFKGTSSVKHYVRMLRDDVGLDTIKENMVKDLGDIKVGSHYGCHMLKPSDIMGLDDPEHPTIMDDLVSTTGAVPIDYLNKLECCAGPVMGVRENVTWSVGQDKVNEIKKTGDMMTTACPFCFLTFERAQLMNEEGENLPVMHLSQILGLGMGMGEDELGIGHNNIDASGIVEKVI